ncbi:fused MFS/spermidine synthase [Catenovulum sp. SM1970]|uniref:fused MFS/spermidine synthase n=1 Tax=Marinifaba aquimaris TaxID=2741323 RepID=UPI00157322F0|nr:fused MFS/spermidine synthase [Marinifaba aquimaris]NTS77466.1 fused MFS/spermidine synthase [Marinifaba aquimaris]
MPKESTKLQAGKPVAPFSEFDINQLIYLSQRDATFVQAVSDTLTLRENNNWRWLYSTDRTLVSIMDLKRAERIVSTNQQIMLASLALLGVQFDQTLKVLNLGLGGGAFERFFSYYFNQLKLTSVELDNRLIELAIKQFAVESASSKIDLINNSADAFIQQQENQNYQLVLCDIFSGNRHPSCIQSPDFYHHIAKNLSATGVLAINLLPADNKQLLNILVLIRQVMPWTLIAEIAGTRNIIFIASKSPFVKGPLALQHAKTLSAQLDWDLTESLGQLTLLPNL